MLSLLYYLISVVLMALSCGSLPIVNYKKNSGKKKKEGKNSFKIHTSAQTVVSGQHTMVTPSFCVLHNGLTNSNPFRSYLTLQKGFILHTHRSAQKQPYGLQRGENNYIT